MSLHSYEGLVTNGQIRLKGDPRLAEEHAWCRVKSVRSGAPRGLTEADGASPLRSL